MPPENANLPAIQNNTPPNPQTAAGVLAMRELFWNNVIREMLTSLSVLSVERAADVYDPQIEQAHHHTFDGRLAVITNSGQRIPIAEVHPMLACSVPGTAAERRLSAQVQCSVFQIRTPSGEIHTIPLHEIRSFHALTPELMQQLREQAEMAQQAQESAQRSQEPFGFAAFTSLADEERRGDLTAEDAE